ncbi:MAG: DUF6484 domain-containing protein [Desulfobacteraceae bacterium]|nr:DUF6484 domain-containing protein [Desulfobacteraceae bacterium]
MNPTPAKVRELKAHRSPACLETGVGRLVAISGDGQAFIDHPADGQGVRPARVLEGVFDAHENWRFAKDLPVLLHFENGDPNLPIIIGIVRNKVETGRMHELDMTRPGHGEVDRKRVVFNADEEIVLRCGKSSVTLQKDGRVVIRGTRITSRAALVNKIKGASVSIN